jgi:hypothetical protein
MANNSCCRIFARQILEGAIQGMNQAMVENRHRPDITKGLSVAKDALQATLDKLVNPPEKAGGHSPRKASN